MQANLTEHPSRDNQSHHPSASPNWGDSGKRQTANHPFIHLFTEPTLIEHLLLVRSKWGNPHKMFSNSWNTVVIFKNWGQITLGKSEASPFQVSFSMQKELGGVRALGSFVPFTYCTLKRQGEWIRLVSSGKTHWSRLAQFLPFFFLRVSCPHEDDFSASLCHTCHRGPPLH